MRLYSRWLLLPCLLSGIVTALHAQAAPATAVSHPCVIAHYKPTDADTAFEKENYAAAESLYRAALAKNATDPAAMTGLIRTLLSENKGADALAAAQSFDAAYPNNARVLALLGQAHLRLGDMDDVISYLNRSMKLDPCNGWAHFQASRFLSLSGMFAHSKTQLNIAHMLLPDEPLITRRWNNSNPPTETAEQYIARLTNELTKPDLSPEKHDAIEQSLKVAQTRQRGDCQAVTPIAGTVEKLVPISNGPILTPESIHGAGLDIQLNGKHRRFQVDTGASGLLLSRSVAVSAGLIPELEIKGGGIGDDGPTGEYVTHVDDIKIGSMEYKNCIVRVLEKSSVLNTDGLIGTDVFKNYLVTLDFPEHQLRLDPLPARPGETAHDSSLSTTGEDAKVAEAAPQDRYIAPEMKDWDGFYRVGHSIIVPTMIGNAPMKLFILDSGASVGFISPAAARLVSGVYGTDRIHVHGLSGEVKNVATADRVIISFAGVRQVLPDMTSIDTGNVSRNAGVEISGFIGFPTLRQVTVAIDYRDNLIHVTYDPKHDGFH
jgi:hypothetical protein